MGYAVPAAMGAKVAMPEKLVWAIDGDGCFQMTNQELATCTINNIPIKVEAYGCLSIRVEKVEEVDAAIKLAMETNDRPVVIDFIVGRDAMVWPMVPAGVSNDAVQYARDAAPIWDGEE